jgi:hypothetical protein
MKTFLLGSAVVAAATCLVSAQETKIAAGFMKAPLESRMVKGAPYSAEIVREFVQTLSDGNRIVRKTTGRVYRDAEGRVRREEDRPSGGPSISITDPVAGVSYSLDPERRVAWKTPSLAGALIMNKLADLKTTFEARTSGVPFETLAVGPTVLPEGVMTMEFSGGRVAMRRSGDGEQRNEETLGSKVVEGVVADGRRTTTTIPAGAVGNERAITIVAEEWTSPELQVLVLTEHKDPRGGDSSYRLLNVNRAEPSPTLFDVPSDYTIRETGIRRFDR